MVDLEGTLDAETSLAAANLSCSGEVHSSSATSATKDLLTSTSHPSPNLAAHIAPYDVSTGIMTIMENAYRMWVEGKEVEGRAEQSVSGTPHS